MKLLNANTVLVELSIDLSYLRYVFFGALIYGEMFL